MQAKRIIDILKTDKVGISCELFPPKQGTELQNSLEIVNKIAQVQPSYMSVTYGAGGSTVGYSTALAKQVPSPGKLCSLIALYPFRQRWGCLLPRP